MRYYTLLLLALSLIHRCSTDSGCSRECARCDGSSSDCLLCAQGFWLASGDCEECAKGCRTCSSDKSCSACLEGHYLEAGYCRACPPACPDCSGSSACEEGKPAKRPGTAALAIGLVAAVVGLGLLATAVWCCCRKKRDSSEASAARKRRRYVIEGPPVSETGRPVSSRSDALRVGRPDSARTDTPTVAEKTTRLPGPKQPQAGPGYPQPPVPYDPSSHFARAGASRGPQLQVSPGPANPYLERPVQGEKQPAQYEPRVQYPAEPPAITSISIARQSGF